MPGLIAENETLGAMPSLVVGMFAVSLRLLGKHGTRRGRKKAIPMTPVHVEKLKQEYTDQYVVVDESRPELARFAGAVGQVKTVNGFGRALVQFDIEKNLGWFDIEVDYLKVVDKPPPKEPEAKKKAPARKPAVQTALPEKEPSALEKARASNGKETAGNAAVANANAPKTPAEDESDGEKAEPK